MYNNLIRMRDKLKQNKIVISCIKCMDKIHDKAYTLKWNGYSYQANKLVEDTQNMLITDYPIYMQYVRCCKLLNQYDYGHFNREFDRECENFIKKYYNK